MNTACLSRFGTATRGEYSSETFLEESWAERHLREMFYREKLGGIVISKANLSGLKS